MLHHFPLGLFVMEGNSHAEDVVRHVENEGAMSDARESVGHCSSSSQAEALLLSKQNPENAVKCIQDVKTFWWSTYSMCKCLLHLQPHFTLLKAGGF
jgi:hypothetical protein